MKKLLLLFMLMMSFHSYAQTFDYGNFRFEIISEEEKTCEVIELTKNEKNETLIVPSEVEFSLGTYKVIRIGKNALESCRARSIVISEGIQEIEDCAFRYSYFCRSVTMPTTLKVVRGSAFFSCDSLSELHISNLGKWCEVIFEDRYSSPFGEKNFYNKKKLKKAYLNGTLITELEIPSAIDTIKNYTFFGWENLETLIIPATIKRISDDAFVGCSSLTSLDIENSDVSLSIGVDSDNGSAYIPGGRKYPMFKYSPLTTINVGRNLSYTTDGEAWSPFRGIQSLKSVNFSHCVTEIPNNLFAGCSYFPIYIPNSVTIIGNSAFSTGSYTADLEVAEIYIPSSVKYCGLGWPVAKIRKVYIDNLENWCNMRFSRRGGPLNANDSSYKKQCQLYVNGEETTDLIIPEGVKSINRAFYGWSSLKSVILSSSVKEIADSAFYLCKSLDTVEFNEGLMEIGDYAFKGTALTKLNLPQTLTKIGLAAFIDCNLKNLIIPDNVIEIGDYAFAHMHDVESITLGGGLEKIGKNTFYFWPGSSNYFPPSKLECRTTLPPMCDGEFINRYYESTKLIVPDNGLKSYMESETWQKFNSIETYPIYLVNELGLTSHEVLVVGDTMRLSPVINPESASNKHLVWTSDNNDVATVDELGLVTAISVGDANITCSTVDGSRLSATCRVTINPINAESITLDKTELTLTVGASEKLTATVLPEDVTDNTVTWSTSDASIATVDAEGNVTAVSVGEATITASCGEKSASCKVTVNPILAESITLDKTELTLTIGTSAKLTATVLPEDVTDKTIIWSTSDGSIATVDTEGNVTAIALGEVTISATCGDKSATCKVTVNPIFAESITLNKTELTLTIGATDKLTATVLPEDVTDNTVTWSTSDASIATVDAEGNVTAVSVGEVTITASCGDKSVTCKVTVNPILAESIALDKTELTLTVGASEKLTATVLPEDVTDKTIIWSTSDGSHGGYRGQCDGNRTWRDDYLCDLWRQVGNLQSDRQPDTCREHRP